MTLAVAVPAAGCSGDAAPGVVTSAATTSGPATTAADAPTIPAVSAPASTAASPASTAASPTTTAAAGPGTLLASDGEVEVRAVAGELGEDHGARIHLDDMVLTPDGIEVTIDEHDGLPHAFGRFVAAFPWAELDGIVDVGRLFWVVGEELRP